MSGSSDPHILLAIKGVGPTLVARLATLGIHNIQDLLFHLPVRYQDRTQVTSIGALRPGMETNIRGEVQLSQVKYGRQRMLLSRITDGTGFITLRFFHFNARQQASLESGATIHCFGEVRGSGAGLEMVHPEYRLVEAEASVQTEEHLTPVYPMTEGLSQQRMRGLIDSVLANEELFVKKLSEYLPDALLKQEDMPSLQAALRYVHHPPPGAPLDSLLEGLHPSQRRLAFEELLAQQLSLRQLRVQHQQHSAPALCDIGEGSQGQYWRDLLAQLPFTLTGAQQRVITEITNDLQRERPMQRLVQGDVGSGKTLVAAAATLQAVEAGYQVAVMAPTELLAEQHRHNFSQWLNPLGINVQWLSGKIKARERKATLSAMEDGSAQVIVGTQALFQEGIEFHQLGLVIIDEQHRFGVHQRLALREKGSHDSAKGQRYPHQLIMTATPIPRTLAQTAYADLDVSVIDELPPGRTPVDTVVISEQRRDEVVARVHRACREGRQAYWVCTLVEESESLQCQNAQETADSLHAALPDLRIGLVHGRLKSAEKERVMQAFKAADIDLLVATTVIEVGVDVPNASLMIIDNAERLGLSQLHQLRGRVGRGDQKSSCVLLYAANLSKIAQTRLATLRETNDGFVVAQRDLEIRGPGELLGTRQTGLVNLRIADFQRDQDLFPRIAVCAETLLREYPAHVAPLIRRWLGDGMRYSEV